MAALAKVLISKTTLNSDQATITFNSIPTSYTSLEMICSVRGTSTTAAQTLGYTSNAMIFLFNSNSSSNTDCGSQTVTGYTTDNYATAKTYPTTSYTLNTYRSIVGTVLTDGNTSNAYTVGRFFLNASSSTSTTKIFNGFMAGYSAEGVSGIGHMNRVSGMYGSTSAVTRIDISLGTGSFKTGSSFALYGITTA